MSAGPGGVGAPEPSVAYRNIQDIVFLEHTGYVVALDLESFVVLCPARRKDEISHAAAVQHGFVDAVASKLKRGFSYRLQTLESLPENRNHCGFSILHLNPGGILDQHMTVYISLKLSTSSIVGTESRAPGLVTAIAAALEARRSPWSGLVPLMTEDMK